LLLMKKFNQLLYTEKLMKKSNNIGKELLLMKFFNQILYKKARCH
jgi:hypothetical protein